MLWYYISLSNVKATYLNHYQLYLINYMWSKFIFSLCALVAPFLVLNIFMCSRILHFQFEWVLFCFYIYISDYCFSLPNILCPGFKKQFITLFIISPTSQSKSEPSASITVFLAVLCSNLVSTALVFILLWVKTFNYLFW